MAGVTIRVDDSELVAGAARLEGVVDAPRRNLAEGIGRLVQEQTRRRIEEEKTAPDGTPWPANRQGTPILYASGALARSVDFIASDDGVIVGSGLVYARIHQAGGRIKPKDARALRFMAGNQLVFAREVTIPQRQWLGLSAGNRDEIVEATEDWLRGLLQ